MTKMEQKDNMDLNENMQNVENVENMDSREVYSKKRKRRRMLKKIAMVLGVFLFIFWFEIIRSNRSFEVKEYELSFDNLPEEFEDFTIVQISDLHSHVFGENNEPLIEKIREIKPDIIAVTGDLIDRHDEDFDQEFHLLKVLSAEFPTYYIRGNHEKDRDDASIARWNKMLDQTKVINLNNRTLPINRLGKNIWITGLDEDLKYYFKKSDRTQLVINDYVGPGEGFNLLLAHNPLYFEDYIYWGADLTLSGHVHGGMIRLPFVGGVFSPEGRLFPKYDAGPYEQEGSIVLVSKGLGASGIPYRMFNKAELTVVKLKPGKGAQTQ